jgi:hypothetical protein
MIIFCSKNSGKNMFRILKYSFIHSFIHSLFSWSTNSSSSWNPLLSYLTYTVLGLLNPAYTLVIISPSTCEDYPNLKMEAAGSCLPNYEASHPKRDQLPSHANVHTERAPVIRSERIISCHLSLRKKTGNYQGVSRFSTLKPH